ncbi:hypothetical protein DRE_04698 [Drechslerella stenobrocha 248]|uniref:SH3 domain-containing protein n=1 Tax=Drechslerella stenobrocha 248 TaxID=1043628 RepID=W7HSD2_9PEZI|nr:hypothetical protein DRE_04698 [Drechslerella stenobrocha 248]
MDHSNHIRHLHHLRKRIPVAEPQGGTRTVVEVVVVTQDPNFDGAPAGFMTVNGAGSTLTEIVTATPTPEPKPSSSAAPKRQSVFADNISESSRPQSTLRTSSRSVPLSTLTSASPLSTNAVSRTSTFHSSATLGSATSSAGPSETGSPTNSAGLTIGAYAGIVGGGVVLILLAIVAVAVCLKRRKNSSYEKPEDEKKLNRMSFNDRSLDSPVSLIPEPKPAALAPAPKLEIRPITQFDDSFLPMRASGVLKPEDRSTRAPQLALSIDNKKLAAGPFDTPEPSPAMSAFSDTSNVSLPIQGTPTSPGPNSSAVHRVLADFKPSMADELELNANELVRLLHEYDDGWALCIRMDRTQQGVCPRTCLSARPVKPRPPPGSRGPTPIQTGAGMRGPGQSPPRPFSPGGQPQSPGFGSGSRPQSPRSPSFSRPPMSPKGMPGPPRRPMGPGSRPQSPMNARQPHPLSKVQRDDEVQFHAM